MKSTPPTSSLRPGLLILAAALSALAAPAAEPSATGTISGRVLNATSGSYLNNARVAVAGTSLETYTDENGDYLLVQVRPGRRG